MKEMLIVKVYLNQTAKEKNYSCYERVVESSSSLYVSVDCILRAMRQLYSEKCIVELSFQPLEK